MTALEWKQMYESEEFRKTFLCKDERLGACYSKDGTLFRVWAPKAEKVVLHLYETGTEEEKKAEAFGYSKDNVMFACENGIFECQIEGDLNKVYYTFEIFRDGEGIETPDPYSVAAGANSKRSMVIDLASTNPVGWKEDAKFSKPIQNAVIYELHVKDFSYDIHSGISEKNRGKYLAFTEQGTTVDAKGLKSTGISYLKELGITHVHLLPTYDFGSVDETGADDQFNWGYDPVLYNVPEGSYATDAKNGEVRILEFKQMVKALHDASIGVILDMVFNHTYSMDSPLQKTAPYYYYRQKEDGSLSNGSGCGNETASEREMYRKFMVESVLYWAKEYHVDGFRFDLMGVHDVDTMNAIREALNKLPNGKRIMMYGEPWYAELVALKAPNLPATKANVQKLDEHIAIFHDGTRDAIKGSVFEAREGGFVNGGSDLEEEIKQAICAWCYETTADGPKSPSQVISYVSAHDNYTLWDKLALTLMDTPDYQKGTETMIRVNKLIAAMIQMSFGTPFFQAGEEFLRTKFGDENSYASSPLVNQLDWLRREEHDDVVQYYKGLIRLRKRCPVFFCDDGKAPQEVLFDRAANKIVSYKLPRTGSLQWSQLYVIFNAGNLDTGLQIPDGTWQLLVDESSSLWMDRETVYREKTVTVKAHSACILGKVNTGARGTFDRFIDQEKETIQKSDKGGKVMDFISKMGEKITETGKWVADTAKDQAEIISLKSQISNCDSQIRRQYEAIGKLIFEAEKENEESSYTEQIDAIKKSMKEKEELQQKVDLIKNSREV